MDASSSLEDGAFVFAVGAATSRRASRSRAFEHDVYLLIGRILPTRCSTDVPKQFPGAVRFAPIPVVIVIPP
jgi:hypothetical protein